MGINPISPSKLRKQHIIDTFVLLFSQPSRTGYRTIDSTSIDRLHLTRKDDNAFKCILRASRMTIYFRVTLSGTGVLSHLERTFRHTSVSTGVEKLVLDGPLSGYVQKGNALTRRGFLFSKNLGTTLQPWNQSHNLSLDSTLLFIGNLRQVNAFPF